MKKFWLDNWVYFFVGLIIISTIWFFVMIIIADTSDYHELEYFIQDEFDAPDELILEYQVIKKEYGNEIDKYYVIVTVLTDDWVDDSEVLVLKHYVFEVEFTRLDMTIFVRFKINLMGGYFYHYNSIRYLNVLEIKS